jgi:hypothetical protein
MYWIFPVTLTNHNFSSMRLRFSALLIFTSIFVSIVD